jgi:hypothetical protein
MLKDEIATVLAGKHLARASSARITRWRRSASAFAPRARAWKIPTNRSAFSAGGSQRRRQNRDRAGAFRPAVRRRAQHDHHQHVGVSGSAHGFHAEGIASRICGLRRRRRADRSRAARPYSVVLLDEVEKAHPDVLELFFQVFDKGRWRTARAARSISRTPSSS